jgi:heat-inducible transcriptional repressor
MKELTERRQVVLAMVVQEYINKARPVGSKTLVERYGLEISPATVRNEMAYLEETGYLTRFHTSAGRVPTEKGYRYFVERLMSEAELPLAEQRMIRHQFHQVRMELDQWMRLAAAVLARTAHSAALVTAPRTTCCHLKHLELISIKGPTVLLILILQEGRVKQQMSTLTQPVNQTLLRRTANRLNDLFQNLDAGQIAGWLPSLVSLERQVADLILDIMLQAEERSYSDIYRDGLLNVLRQPEFTAAENVRQVINVLESRDFLEKVMAEALSVTGVQVIIGGEGIWDELSNYSMVLARYGVIGHAVGTLGVLGPMRMPYQRTISTVRYVADLLSDLITELYVY